MISTELKVFICKDYENQVEWSVQLSYYYYFHALAVSMDMFYNIPNLPTPSFFKTILPFLSFNTLELTSLNYFVPAE